MTPRHLLLAGAIALALSACGKSPAPPTETPAPTPVAVEQAAPAETEAAPAVEAPVEAAPIEAAPAAAATGSKPAVVTNCATTIESNDSMQYNADSIAVPASCSKFTINLKHVGKLPVAAMGHNVVIAKEADMRGIAADGMTVTPEHLKAGDDRVIAHTDMVGGGGSASLTFDVAKLKDGGPYKFFCSFPGHLALMQGSLQVQ